jgi:PAS domain S-box-containing protein
MSRSLRSITCLLAVLGLAAGARLGAAEPAALKVLMENASPPFVVLNDQGQPEGFAVELIRTVAADQGLRVEFDLRPWQEVYADFLQGRGDILGLVAWSEERAARMDISLPFEILVCGLYTHRDRPGLHTPADLRGKRIAVIRDAITHEFARRQPWSADIRPYATLRECLEAVERGDCDAALGMRLVTDQHIKKLGLGNVVRSGLDFPAVTYRLCLAVQPGQKALLARLNQGIHNLILTQQHDALHEKWLGELEPRRLHWRDLQPWLPLATFVAIATLGVLLWQRRLLTRLARQARAIRESEERLQLVFEGSQDAFWDWEVDTGRVLRSPRWAGMLGYTLDEIGRTRESFLDLVHPADRDAILADEKLVFDRKNHFAIEFRMKSKSGEWKWILDRGKVVARDPATGAPRRITGTHTDITVRKLAEAEAERLHHRMLETQKLESLGVLAGGIAHDFNNLLTVIIGNGTLARLESGESAANQSRLDSVIASARRAAELCHQLLAYAGQGGFTTERISLNELVTEATRLLELSIGKNARLEFNLAPDLPRNEADPAQLRQVIMNLVINASEALAGRPGTIRLTTSALTLGPPDLGVFGPAMEVAAGEYVCLEVTDTGEGMTPAVLARIFDPFYSTKFTGRGLGLAAVLGIVRTHHGTLKVDSTPGRGSVFRVYLPLKQVGTVHPFAAPDAPAGTKL